MATQRVQCQFRDSTLDQVKLIADEMNLSLSKAVGYLVEEALAARGSLTNAPTQSPMKAEVVMSNSRKAAEVELDDEDLKLLKKIKLLKELGI